MAHRIGRTPQINQPSSNRIEDIRGLARTIFIDSTDIRARLVDALPKDGSEAMEGPLRLASYTTVNLPSATGIAGALVYDSTTQEVKYSDGTNWIPLAKVSAIRIRLTQDETFTVGTSQDYATMQAAWNDICANYDLAGFTVTLQLANQTHTGGLTDHDPDPGFYNRDGVSPVGEGKVILRGDPVTPTNVVVDTSGGWGVWMAHGYIEVTGIRLHSGTAAGSGLLAAWSGIIIAGAGVVFGDMEEHMHASSGGQIVLTNAYTISGDADVHYNAAEGSGQIRADGSYTVTLSGTPAFANSFAEASGNSIIDLRSITYSGAATGTRFDISGNAQILTGTDDLEYLPGDGDGVITEGGYFDSYPAPGIVFLDSGSASSAAAVDILLPDIELYRGFKIFVTQLLPDLDADTWAMRTSTDGGNNFDSAADDYVYCEHFFSFDFGSTTSHDVGGDDSASEIGLGGGYFEDVTSHAEITIWEPRDAGSPCTIGAIINKWSAAPGIEHNLITGARADAGDVDAVRFFFTTDNISMVWALYGIR